MARKLEKRSYPFRLVVKNRMGANVSSSKADLEIESQLRTMDPNSRRHQVLSTARDFKTAWVDLAQVLTVVRENAEYKTWGYTTFEAYCRREIKIRAETANKLTRSFTFLREHEPTVLQQREEREVPALDVVDMLSKAQEKSQLPDDVWDNIRQEVFAPQDNQPSRSQILKRLKAADPEAFKPIEKPKTLEATDPMTLKKATMLAERLQAVLSESGISESCVRLVGEIVEQLNRVAKDKVDQCLSNSSTL
jgi:hypothetical protein